MKPCLLDAPLVMSVPRPEEGLRVVDFVSAPSRHPNTVLWVAFRAVSTDTYKFLFTDIEGSTRLWEEP